MDAAGSLALGAEVSLSFSSGGRVAEVLVDEGQVVEAGQPLARLETDGLELQVAQAQAALAAAEAQLAQSLAPPRPQEIAVQEANLAAARAQLDLLLAGTTAEEIETAQASVDDARVALEQARLRLEKATATAPVAGTVTLLDVQPGEIATANQPVVVLSDLATLEVEVNLDEADVARVAVGQEARVRLDAFPGVEMAGEVTYVASVAQSQRGILFVPQILHICPYRWGFSQRPRLWLAGRDDVVDLQ